MSEGHDCPNDHSDCCVIETILFDASGPKNALPVRAVLMPSAMADCASFAVLMFKELGPMYESSSISRLRDCALADSRMRLISVMIDGSPGFVYTSTVMPLSLSVCVSFL